MVSPTILRHLHSTRQHGASDLFLDEGGPPRLKLHGAVQELQEPPITKDDLAGFWRACGADPEQENDHDSRSATTQAVLESFHSGHATVVSAIAAQYDAALAAVADGPPKTNGVAWGTEVATALLAHRADDGSGTATPYTAAPDAGIWRPTPPAIAPALLPHWGKVIPFAAISGSQFRPQQPPVLSSQAYTLDYQLVKDYGGTTSTARTPDQTEVARFWVDGPGTETPPDHWMIRHY